MRNWAVFTGDIVGSSDMGSDGLSQVFVALEEAAGSIGQWPDSTGHFARFRGDGWQMALPEIFALRGALVLRAAVRATAKGRDTRIGIGIGSGQIDGGDLARADGPVFVQSGRALDAMRRGARMSAPDAGALLRVALPLADRIVAGWTSKQAQVAQALLAPVPPTHEVLSEALGHSRQMTQKQADAAAVHALVESCEIYEQTKMQHK